ncbi:MAG: DNA polymerase III subunit alpha [Bacteroidetes bacterium 4572_112]|nr:MAG: DNA polymerase III subunit alpha [Bacteroidetes bacterium 4572_112]
MLINTHSYYSLRYGTLSIEELILQTKAKAYTELVLSDINNSTAIVDFVKLCNKHNINPIAGIEFRNKNELLYIGIAKNNDGFRELNAFLSEHNLQKKPLPNRAPMLNNAFFVYDYSKLQLLSNLRTNEFIGIRYFEIPKLYKIHKDYRKKLLALHPITHSGGNSYNLHFRLRAIDNNCLLSQVQDNSLAHFSERIPSPKQLSNLFLAAPYLIENTKQLVSECSISFDFSGVKNKKCYTKSKEEDRILLRQLAYKGMNYRYNRYDRVAKERVDKELAIINQMNFSAYFLITWDIIQYSISKGYYHVGRGSGANSVVAYCLKITDVDPIELDLYFERFINPKRSTPPDFDIDYSWLNRDDVQEYIFQKYGKEHTALLGTISTFKGKSIYRELGKVYGLPKEEIDDLIKYPQAKRNNTGINMEIHTYAAMMSGFPNLRSIHAGGVIVSEEPLTTYTALDMPPKGFPTTQWDMYVAEDIGYEKLDILSQRGIGHINDTVRLVKQNKGELVDFHNVEKFKTDQGVRKLLMSGETLGCFYIESPAMRGLIRKLRCDNYLTLVAASSIIRPGVSKSGMMREYINRYNNPKGFKYIHPIMEQQLGETFGVMVYQEDVLKICHHFAGLDLAESDVLRRAMSGKTRSKEELNRIVGKFHSNCKARNYPDAITKEVWRQIESFAGYSFSKAHSASYAVESYQSLYLKTYYPMEFITAVINNFGGFYNTWVYFNEANKLGAKVMLPNVNHSLYLTNIEEDRIYIGFIHLRSLDRKIAKHMVKERKENGEFTSLADFASRVLIGIEMLLILIRSGAFNDINKNKAALMWEAHSLLKHTKHISEIQEQLFPYEKKQFKLPQLSNDAIVNAYDEIELIGFPVTSSYFDLLETKYRGEIMYNTLNQNIGKTVRMLGQLVTIKYVKTMRKDYMHFSTFVDVEGNLFDTVHFPDSLKNYPFRGEGIYLLLGKVVEEFGYASLEVHKMAKMAMLKNPIA